MQGSVLSSAQMHVQLQCRVLIAPTQYQLKYITVHSHFILLIIPSNPKPQPVPQNLVTPDTETQHWVMPILCVPALTHLDSSHPWLCLNYLDTTIVVGTAHKLKPRSNPSKTLGVFLLMSSCSTCTQNTLCQMIKTPNSWISKPSAWFKLWVWQTLGPVLSPVNMPWQPWFWGVWTLASALCCCANPLLLCLSSSNKVRDGMSQVSPKLGTPSIGWLSVWVSVFRCHQVLGYRLGLWGCWELTR